MHRDILILINLMVLSSSLVLSWKVASAAMAEAFFSLYCLVKNTLPPKVFFKFFKVQILFFFQKHL